MANLKFFLTLLTVVFLAFEISALQCLQGSPKKNQFHLRVTKPKPPSDEGLLGSYQKSIAPPPAPLTKKKPFRERLLNCLPHQIRNSLFPNRNLEKLSANLKEIQQAVQLSSITYECIEASLKRANTTGGYFCDSDKGKPVDIGSPGPQGPCMSSEVAHYLTWATNQAIACLNNPEKPLDPLLVFKKINQESGFHFFQAYRKGVGIGQLTSIALDQISSNTRYIEEVIQSPKAECKPFQKALKRKTANAHNWCSLIEPSEGLARNLIYSISYFLHLRDDGQLRKMSEGLEKMRIGSADYYNYGTLAAYGREGKEVQKGILEAARKSPRHFERFLKEATQRSEYLKEIETTFRETLMQNNLTEDLCVKRIKN